MMNEKMITKQHYTRNGYTWTVQRISDDVSHLIIRDGNLYPDNDSRSQENREWVFPINDEDDFNEIKKLFKKK
jgi:hypothetical protein